MSYFVSKVDINVKLPEKNIDVFNEAVEVEENRHHLKTFYHWRSPSKHHSERAHFLNKFTHAMAIFFIAMTWAWIGRRYEDDYEADTGNDYSKTIHAFYRVVDVMEGNSNCYILESCHLNTYGLKRMDLRFIKVDMSSRILPQSELLYPGDILRVYSLTPLKEMDLHNTVSHLDIDASQLHTNLFWSVRVAELMPRKIQQNEQFIFYTREPNSNCRLVLLKNYSEIGTIAYVHNLGNTIQRNRVHTGSLFLPSQNISLVRNHFDETKKFEENFIVLPKAMIQVIEFGFDEHQTILFENGRTSYSINFPNHEERSYAMKMHALFANSIPKAIDAAIRDTRVFKMEVILRAPSSIEFRIPNPPKNPTFGKWTKNAGIVIQAHQLRVSGTIFAVTCQDGYTAVSASFFPENLRNIPLSARDLFVSQSLGGSHSMWLNGRLLAEIDDESNGSKILKMLYGGTSVTTFKRLPVRKFHYPSRPLISLDGFQNNYIHQLKQELTVLIVDAPFGSGKTLAVATAMLELNQHWKGQGIKQIIVTSNINSLRSLHNQLNMSDDQSCRYLAFDGTKESKTSQDFEDELRRYTERFDCYSSFSLFNPDAILTTTGFLKELIKKNLLNASKVKLVQIDEAHLLVDYEFIWLLNVFSKSCFAFLGDKARCSERNSYYYNNVEWTFGFGNVFKHAIELPTVQVLNFYNTYRSHPIITNCLASICYEDLEKKQSIINCTDGHERMRFLRTHCGDIWKTNMPIVFVHNVGMCDWNGASRVNETEFKIVETILKKLRANNIRGDDLGVLSFYKAQETKLKELSGLLRGVTFGGINSFSGIEKNIMVIGLTNHEIKKHIENKADICSVLSRAKYGTIIIGNIISLHKTTIWSRILKEVMRDSLVLDEADTIYEEEPLILVLYTAICSKVFLSSYIIH